MNYRLLLLLVSAIIIGCDSNSLVDFDENELAAVNLKEGIHKKQVALGNGQIMDYVVAAPRLTHGREYPLVVALHGGGTARGRHFSEGYLRSLAEPGLRDLNAIIVAPDTPGSSWVDPISLEAVAELVEGIMRLDKSWPVDPERVVLTGYSAGGIGVWHLTLTRPDLFSIGIPVAADPVVGDREGPQAVPLYIIHGDEDVLFKYDDVVTEVEFLRDTNVQFRFETAEGVTHSAMVGYVEPMRNAAAWLTDEVWDN